MIVSSATVTIPDISLTLDQLLFAIRQLDEPARRQVAEVLLETQMDAQLSHLLQQLAKKSPVDDISDADIAAEVQAALNATESPAPHHPTAHPRRRRPANARR